MRAFLFVVTIHTRHALPLRSGIAITHNERMQALFRTVGYGMLLYAVMYLAWALLAAYGVGGSAGARYALFAVLVLSTAFAARSLGHETLRDIVPHALAWVATIALFDALFAIPSGNWAIFTDPNLWVGYALVLGTPLVFHTPPHYPEPLRS